MVGTERLELSHLAALEPKSSASTNSATSPNLVISFTRLCAIIADFYHLTSILCKFYFFRDLTYCYD